MCIDGDTECRAAAPATCPVHGNKESGEAEIKMDYDKINKHIDDLKQRGIANPHIGVAVEAVPVVISDVNQHALKRGITKEEAQSYVDTAKVMLQQKNARNNYLSKDEVCQGVFSKKFINNQKNANESRCFLLTAAFLIIVKS